ncbi:MAG: alpha/beta hydrolase [Massilia sp.]|nr:alpha/beta hydrolase [Massilia sp.]
MIKPLLHFSHGNSFPSGVYRQFLDGLRDEFDIHAIDMFGHDAAFPVSDGWSHLVAQLIAQLERYPAPTILVGHSLGGMLSLMAAKQRPDLVRCVVMLDSPVVAGWRAWLLRVAKTRRWDDRFSPAKFSQRRRMVWPDADAAYRHFLSKPVFSAWAPGVLADYVEHGLMPHAEGVQLRFSRAVETDIYRSIPHHLGALVRPPFPVPIGFIGGTESVELRQAGMTATRRLVGRHFTEIEGGHLFPMTSPELAATLACAMIAALLAGASI